MNKTIQEYLSQPQKEKVIYDCEDCGKHVEKGGKAFRKNPHLKCKSCYMLSKYGVTTNIARSECREKSKKTIIEKYGSYENYTKIRIENSKKAVKEKYGVENNFQRQDVKDKIHEKLDYKKMREKTNQTNIERYGTPVTGKITHIYKGVVFDSSWELAFWIWCEDNGKSIKRNLNPIFSKSGKKYYPDFVVDGKLYEIKGDFLTKQDGYEDKLEAFIVNHVEVLMSKEIQPILKYIYKKYGKNYLKKFLRKTNKSFKRKPTEENEKTKKHHRIHFKCASCGRDVYASVYVYNHFNDKLCKNCRNLKKQTN